MALALIGSVPLVPFLKGRIEGLIGARAYATAHGDKVVQHIVAAESDFGAGRIYAFATSEPPEAAKAFERRFPEA